MGRQNVLVEFFYGGAWHAAPVYARDEIVITRGRQNESSEPTPSTAAFSIDNRSGDWNIHNPTAALYGLVGQNTPVRIALAGSWRFWGEVASIAARRTLDFDPATGRGDAWVVVEAAGPLRRIGQGRDPIASPLRRAILAAGPSAYWPLEDASDATAAASAVAGVAPMEPFGYSRFQAPGTGDPVPAAGLPKFATGNGIPGSLPVPDLAQGGVLVGRPPVPAGNSEWRIGFVMVAPRDKGQDPVVPISWTTTVGIYTDWQFQIDSFGIFLTASDDGGVAGWSASATLNVFDGQPHYYEIEGFDFLDQIDVRVYVDDVQVAALGPLNAPDLTGAVGSISAVTVNPLEVVASEAAIDDMPQLGHVALWQPYSGLTATVPAMRGHAGEATMTRYARLAGEQGVTAFYTGPDVNDVQHIGVQRAATFAQLLAELERTEASVLYESRHAVGLVLPTGRSLHAAPVAATLDYAAGHLAPPLQPVLDDQATRNDVTAKSTTTGATARRTLDAGPLSTAAPPDGIGRYSTQLEVNPADVGYLGSYANRALYAGTLGKLRFPRVTVDLVANPGLTAAVGELEPADRFQIINLPPDITPDVVDLVMLGSREVIGSHTRRITINAAPYATIDAAVADAVDVRADSETSTLAAAVDATTTTLPVTRPSTSAPWTADPAEFPFDVALDGERVTAQTIGPLLDDPFDRTVASGWGTAPTGQTYIQSDGGTPADYYTDGQNGVIAVSTADNTPHTMVVDIDPVDRVELRWSVSLDTVPTGGPVRPSAIARHLDVSNYLYAELEISDGGAVDIKLGQRIGGAFTTLEQLAAVLTITAGAPIEGRALFEGATIRAKAWQGAEPAAWMVETDQAAIATIGQIAWSANASGAYTGPLPAPVRWSTVQITNPQGMTVTRSVNGVNRTWPAGTTVRVWNRPIVGL